MLRIIEVYREMRLDFSLNTAVEPGSSPLSVRGCFAQWLSTLTLNTKLHRWEHVHRYRNRCRTRRARDSIYYRPGNGSSSANDRAGQGYQEEHATIALSMSTIPGVAAWKLHFLALSVELTVSRH